MTNADMIEAMKIAIGPHFIGNRMPDMSGDPLRRATPYERRRIDEAVTAALAVVQPELDRLRAENARLRSALEPFSQHALLFDEGWGDWEEIGAFAVDDERPLRLRPAQREAPALPAAEGAAGLFQALRLSRLERPQNLPSRRSASKVERSMP